MQSANAHLRSAIGTRRLLFGRFAQAFSWLPLAATISDRILVVHGGIGKGDWTLDQLMAVNRPLDFG